MHLSQKQIATAFSNGDFEVTFPYLSENIEWKAINIFACKGKTEVIKQCEGTAKYFATLTTNFKQLDIIEDKNKVVITGTAEFLKDGKRIEFISACDIYEFDENDKLQNIVSYCLSEKNNC